MLTLIVVLIGLAGFMTLAMRRAPLWQWAVGFAVLGVLEPARLAMRPASASMPIWRAGSWRCCPRRSWRC